MQFWLSERRKKLNASPKQDKKGLHRWKDLKMIYLFIHSILVSQEKYGKLTQLSTKFKRTIW